MQDDSDDLGIVLDSGGSEAAPQRAKKQKLQAPKPAPVLPEAQGSASSSGAGEVSMQAQEAHVPEKSVVSSGEKPGIFSGLSRPKPAIFSGAGVSAPQAHEAQGASVGEGKKGIFRNLHLESMKVTPEAPSGCMTSKGIFCRLNAPSAVVQASSLKERVPSGVPGLDEMIEGGFERDSNILITGGPGSGKTTFLFQFLVNGATMYDEPGLFISFEEEKEELFQHYKRFGWDLEGLERGKKVLFVKYAPHEVAKFIDSGGGMLKDVITDAGVRRIAIDSLTSFSMLFKDDYDKRFNIIKFFDILRTWNCTVMLTAERPIELTATYDDFGLEFLVDAVLLIYNVRRGNIRERALEVLKMRGTNQMTRLCPLKITDEGVVVFPSETIFADISGKA